MKRVGIIVSLALSIIFSIFFISAGCPTNLLGTGNSTDPCQITNCTELQNMSSNLTVTYILMSDINCSETLTWNSDAGFNPIGINTDPFDGVFDGRNKTISNLYINRGQNQVGLFGYTRGNISQVGLINVNFSGAMETAGLVGWQGSGTILNSFSTGIVTGTTYTGGLVGYAGGLVSNSYSSAKIQGDNYVGGLVGQISGITNGVINQSYAEGKVNGSAFVGGLVGYVTGIVLNSFSVGNVSGSLDQIGGLVGRNELGTILNSFSVGNVSGGTNIGGLVGTNNPGIIYNCYWNNRSQGLNCYDGGNNGCTAISNNESYFKGNVYPLNLPMSNWSFYDVWEENSTTYPVLTWQGIGTILSDEYCGDGICNNGETTSTCPSDCPAVIITEISLGGGGGGGTSTTTNKEWIMTKVISDLQLKEGINILLGPKEKAEFNLLDYAKSFFGIKTIEPALVVRTSIDSQNITTNVGKILKFDYTKDGYYDLIVYLNSIDNGKVNVTIKKINEKVVMTATKEEVSENKNNETNNNLPSEEPTLASDILIFASDWRIVSMVVGAIILIAGIFIIRKAVIRKKSVVKEQKTSNKKQKHK